MKLRMYSVYDSKALVYGQPMFISSVGSAIRAFTDLCNDPQSIVCKHPTDFVLYEVGEYDDSTGVVFAKSPFVNLGLASDFKKVVKEPVIYNPAASEKGK